MVGWVAGCFVSFCVGAEVPVSIHFIKRAQTIDNIGSSTGMHGDFIARQWAPETVDAIADLLFSQQFDESGSPRGIGLSSFRIQIGAGAEGEKSGIRSLWRRTDCFLRPDGSYDWENGKGTRYWCAKAKEYGLSTVIGYLNSPPVNFTKNGYTFKTDSVFSSNLKDEHYEAYADFLAKVVSWFQLKSMPFDYICPVNEPQWAWDGIPGMAKQEGTPWTNEQIARLVRLLDAELRKHKLETKILIPEAGNYASLYQPLEKNYYAAATDQIEAFWNRQRSDYIGNLSSLADIVAGHAYFSDGSIKELIQTRSSVKTAVAKIKGDLRFWQTEYSLLGKGWTCELPEAEVDEMTAGLLLARVIHVDLTLANASAWQWWSSTEPQLGNVPRYCLIECDKSGEETFRTTKLLWALGHYSRFIRPGMVRVDVEIPSPVSESLRNVMASAFYDDANNRWSMVLINFSNEAQVIKYQTKMLPGGRSKNWNTVGFLTDATENMKRFPIKQNRIQLPPKSIATIISW